MLKPAPSIHLHRRATLPALFGPTEKRVTAFRTDVALFFRFHPFLCAQLPPGGDGPEDDFLALILPQAVDPVFRKPGIAAYQGQVLHQGLGDKHTIKGVSVVKGES